MKERIGKNMAAKAEAKTEAKTEKMEGKKWLVTVDDAPEYCGIGAGGVQFANGQALIESERMAAWFEEHDGYTVTEQ